MLPKNESLRKILVVFSFFETFCTRVGNSERFGQGKPSLSYFILLLISHDGAMAVVGGKRGDPTFGRVLDSGRIGGCGCQEVNWTSSPLPGILASLTRLGIFRQAAMQRDHQVAGVADIVWSFYKGRVLHSGGGVLCGGGVTGADVASKACEESKGRGADSFCVCLSHRARVQTNV